MIAQMGGPHSRDAKLSPLSTAPGSFALDVPNKPRSSSAPRAGSASASRANICARLARDRDRARQRQTARSAREEGEGQSAHRARRHRRHRRRRGTARHARRRKARSPVRRRRRLRLGAEAAARGLARRSRARVPDQCLLPDRRRRGLRGPAEARRHGRVHVVDARQHRAERLRLVGNLPAEQGGAEHGRAQLLPPPPAHAVLSIAPGWVRTDMGGPSATFDVETSCRNVANAIDKQPASPAIAM